MMEQKRSTTRSEDNHDGNAQPRTISRRDFIKLAAATGLLAGCTPIQELATTPAGKPTSTPTSAPTSALTSTPTSTPASIPTVLPTPAVIRRPEIIKAYPDVPSKVVHTRHAGAWEGDDLVPEVLHDMLAAAISELTGLDDDAEAWATLFSPDERIAIKVNAATDGWTHIPLVMAVTERLQAAGIPAEQIFIFDRTTRHLEYRAYPVNRDGPGVRCYGTGVDYTPGWKLMGEDIRLSNVLLACDALINMPILKTGYAGISFAMKNHYGTLDRPSDFHGDRGERFEQAIPELNDLQPIRDRTRLIVGDILTVKAVGRSIWPGNTILMSFDPVAHDAIGLQMTREALTARGNFPTAVEELTSRWLKHAAEIGLGTNDPDNMDVVEIELG